jgi:hypothetical protein
MKSTVCSLLTTAVVLLFAQILSANAATLSANCTTGTNLQTQINLANPGDTIEVSGSCKGRFVISTSLTLDGGGVAVLDGQKLGTVLTVLEPSEGGGVTLNNLTIVNGDAGTGTGGGINSFGSLTLNYVTLANNIATVGGAISLNINVVTINHSTLRQNSAGSGGAISNGDGLLTINDSSIHDNNATFGGGINAGLGYTYISGSSVKRNAAQQGGGIFASDRQFSITQSSIDNNIARDGGGGIYNSHGLGFTVNKSTVSGNTADYGGGIANDTAGYGDTILNNVDVSNNSGLGMSGRGGGGGIWNNGQLTATGSRITANKTHLNGGGIDNFGNLMFDSGSLTNCDIERNVAADGGGIFDEPDSTALTLTNTSLIKNTPNQIAP